MANKLKITGFARFLIFLLIVTPVIYSGVSFYQGSNPMDALKRDFGIDLRGDRTEQVDDAPARNSGMSNSEQKEMTKRIDFLRDKNEELEMENKELRARIEELEGQ